MVLAHAGLELASPDALPEPKGIRQKIAKRRAVKLGKALRGVKLSADNDLEVRERIESGIHSGRIGYTPTTRSDAQRHKLEVRTRHANGEIDDFELSGALEHAGHSHSEHHMHYRQITDTEGSQPLPLNKREQQRLDDLNKLVKKAVKLGDKGKPRRSRRASQAEKRNEILEQRIDWETTLDIDRLVRTREHIEVAAEVAVNESEEQAAARGDAVFNPVKEFDYWRREIFEGFMPQYLGVDQDTYDQLVPASRKAYLRKVLVDLDGDKDNKKSEYGKFVEQQRAIKQKGNAMRSRAYAIEDHVDDNGAHQADLDAGIVY